MIVMAIQIAARMFEVEDEIAWDRRYAFSHLGSGCTHMERAIAQLGCAQGPPSCSVQGAE
eukprot:4934782-Pyramimonas_sp.AAC.1